MTDPVSAEFTDFDLSENVLKALNTLGYERPSPIQAACIPLLMEGRDIIGQAQTGTGKTAAFALPLLNQVELSQKHPQILVLAPTRELAIQVAEAFQAYAANIRGFHVLPIYGGQSYDIQLRQLKRGAHVIVGTPGRVIDHLKRKTLNLQKLSALVLDEADEMLRMGFIDDVEWILQQTPQERQVALFSATMPDVIRKVARQHLTDPAHVRIESKTQTAATIRQQFLTVSGYKKMDALTRILESSDFDAVLVFVRTKNATVEVAEKLEARGFSSEALNGDIAQKMRERTVERLKKGQVDIVVATDVAARGLDVDRISLVVNFDIPYDAESYVHRIGRTGRAGREGMAVLFVTNKERHLLRSIEKMTRHRIEPLQLPSTADINQRRMDKFKQRILDTMDTEDLAVCHDLVKSFVEEHDTDPLRLSAALVKMVQGDEPLLLSENEKGDKRERSRDRDRNRGHDQDRGRERNRGESRFADKDTARKPKPIQYQAKPLKEFPEIKMRRYQLDVGYEHQAQAGHIVGAIANEAELDSCYIGSIDIHDDFTLIDLPDGMPNEVFQVLKKARVSGRPLRIKAFKGEPEAGDSAPQKRPEKQKRKQSKTKRKGKRPAVAKRKQRSRDQSS